MTLKQSLAFCLCLTIAASALGGKPKIVKITAEPKDAAIYVNNTFMGNGYSEFSYPKKRNSVSIIRIELEGYRTVNTKYYNGDTRESIAFSLVPDAFVLGTTPSGIVNKFFSIEVDPKYFKVNADGSRETLEAWKLIHQILLNYFDEIQTTDFNSGYIQTPWHYSKFSMSERQIRDRVVIRDASNDQKVIFQIKISSEAASARNAKHGEFDEIDRIIKDHAPLIQELQTRIGKLTNL